MLVAAAVAGCAAPRTTLPAGARVLARGSLAYAVAFTGDALATVELEERFALVVRDPDSGRERRRVDLGPPERDLPALAVAGDRAWVGGDDRVVRTIDLGRGEVVASWPVGADVTALAWARGGWLAVGDAAGGLCLRRVADAALIHCLAVAGPVTDLVARGDRLWVRAGGRDLTLAVPALAVVADAASPRRWRGADLTIDGREVRVGGRPLLRLAERVRAVAVGPRGELAIAAWVRRLDDPAVVLIPGP